MGRAIYLRPWRVFSVSPGSVPGDRIMNRRKSSMRRVEVLGEFIDQRIRHELSLVEIFDV